MRVVIVGGTGNISISIVELLLAQGHEVTCFNRGQRGGLPAGAHLIEGDRADRPAFEAAMQREAFDVAIDMICFNADDAASDVRAFQGVKQFIQCSTVMTYGKPYAWMPVTEDHPLRPNTPYGVGKAAADAVFTVAWHETGFPVTIIKPSVTHGPIRGLVRQVTRDTAWIDRIRKGKPLLICGDGRQIIQFLHVKDAAPGFVGVIGKERCIGQTYNLVESGYTDWLTFHKTAMRVLGREVELVGVPLEDLKALNIPNFSLCEQIYSHNNYYSNSRILRDVPEFRPQLTLEDAMRDIIPQMEAAGRLEDSDLSDWEDRIIATQRHIRSLTI